MLVELAIGDAYGAGFEYVDPDHRTGPNDLTGYVRHPGHFGLCPGKYTDDTQMSLAIAELIIENIEWIPLNIANKFVQVFKRNPRPGYAKGFYAFLQEIETGQEFIDKIVPNSNKSGGAMRATPCGLFNNVEEVIEKATIQCKVTHDTPEGIEAAVASALITHYFYKNIASKDELPNYLSTYLNSDFWQIRHEGSVGNRGLDSVNAALTSIMKYKYMSEILIDCVNWNGDVDTVACIALSAASFSEEIIQNLPNVLYNNLENGKFGKDYLTYLNIRLLNHVTKGGF